jgi:hypothetical protein
VVGHRGTGFVLAGAIEIGVDAEIQIEKAVPVVIGHGNRGERALQRAFETERVLDLREPPGAIVHEQHRTDAGREHEVLVAVVLDVGEERLRRVVQNPDPGTFRDVLERSITARTKQPVRQSSRLAYVQVLQSVPVRVADGDAVMCVRVTCEHRVDRCHPRVPPATELAAERLVAAKCGRRDLGKHRFRGTARHVRGRRPFSNPPGAAAPIPGDPPYAHVLHAPGVRSAADDVVAHVSAGAIGRATGDGGDQELRHVDVTQLVTQAAQLRDEGSGIERETRRKRFGSLDDNRPVSRV